MVVLMSSEVPKTLSPEYIKRATELVSAVAMKLQDEFGVATENNLICIPGIARAILRKDLTHEQT